MKSHPRSKKRATFVQEQETRHLNAGLGRRLNNGDLKYCCGIVNRVPHTEEAQFLQQRYGIRFLDLTEADIALLALLGWTKI